MNAVELHRRGAKRPAPQAFYRWLREQRERDDPVGDLAREVSGDPDFPKAAGLQRLVGYLFARGACYDAHVALRKASAEFHDCDWQCLAAAEEAEQMIDDDEIAVEDLL